MNEKPFTQFLFFTLEFLDDINSAGLPICGYNQKQSVSAGFNYQMSLIQMWGMYLRIFTHYANYMTVNPHGVVLI